MTAQYFSELTEQFSTIVGGLDQLEGMGRGSGKPFFLRIWPSRSQYLELLLTTRPKGTSNTACGLIPTSRHGEDNWYHCRCGWQGHGGWVQLSENHYLNLLGVLRSHIRASPGMYKCKVCGKENDFHGFENCVFSHHRMYDGVKAAKDAYGRDCVWKGSWEDAYKMSEMEKETFQQQVVRRSAPANGSGRSTWRY